MTRAAVRVLLFAVAMAWITAGVPSADAADAALGGRKLPAGRAGELKALLLERPGGAEAPGWALEYAGLPEVTRLDPVARAAEQLWAARLGLAAGPAGSDRERLHALLEVYERCPIDSMAIRRAATGLTRIGVVVPLTGRYERFGRTLVNGFRLAIDQHNRAFAPTLSLVLHDSEADPLTGARKARWLLRDHGVSILVGELFSVNTAPLAAAAQVTGAILLSPSATNERLAILGDGVFQLHVSDRVLSQALVRLITAGGKKPPLAILAAATREDSLRAIALAAACRSAELTVAGLDQAPPGVADLSDALVALRGRKAAALALVGPPRFVGNAAAQLPSLWNGVPVYGFESLDPDGLNAEARGALEGAEFVTPDYALTGALRDSFETRYQAAYGEVPTRMSVRGYLIGLALTRAIEGGAASAPMLREALRAQVYDSDEGRSLRALRPLLPAEPEPNVIHNGRAIPFAPGGEVP